LIDLRFLTFIKSQVYSQIIGIQFFYSNEKPTSVLF